MLNLLCVIITHGGEIVDIFLVIIALVIILWTLKWFFSEPENRHYQPLPTENIMPDEKAALNLLNKANEDQRRVETIMRLQKQREEKMVKPEDGAKIVTSWLRKDSKV